MALSNNAAPPKFGGHTSYLNLPVAANEWIYRGAMVGVNPAGYAKEFVPGDTLVGWALDEFRADSTAGAASLRGNLSEPGATTIRICAYADHVRIPLSGAARTDIGRQVYATDDNTYSFTGHPDAVVGNVLDLEASGYLVVEARRVGQPRAGDQGGKLIMLDPSILVGANLDENDGYIYPNWTVTGVGAGLTAGTTGLLFAPTTGELTALLDNDNEVQSITLTTPRCFNITKGITADFVTRKSVASAGTVGDFDFGLAGGIDLTTTQFADMQATTASFLYALFHNDGEDNNIDACSDDNSTVVSPTDTTVDNSLTVNTTGRVIVRPTGAVEFWLAGARVLSSTTFSVGASGLLAGVWNLEKSGNTDVPEARIKRARIAGALE